MRMTSKLSQLPWVTVQLICTSILYSWFTGVCVTVLLFHSFDFCHQCRTADSCRNFTQSWSQQAIASSQHYRFGKVKKVKVQVSKFWDLYFNFGTCTLTFFTWHQGIIRFIAERQSYSSHDGNVHLNSSSIENFPRVIQRNPLESVTISPMENSPRVIQRNPLESVKFHQAQNDRIHYLFLISRR